MFEALYVYPCAHVQTNKSLASPARGGGVGGHGEDGDRSTANPGNVCACSEEALGIQWRLGCLRKCGRGMCHGHKCKETL